MGRGDKLTTRVSVRDRPSRARGSFDETNLDLRQEKVDARRFTRSVYREPEGPRVVKVHVARAHARGGQHRWRERTTGREGGAGAIRESATTSGGGSVDPAAKVRRQACRVDLYATQKEWTRIFAEGRDPRCPLPPPLLREEESSSDLSNRELC